MTTGMNGGEVVVETMKSRGVDTVFFVPGGTYVTVMEALSRNQDAIRAVPTRLESSAAPHWTHKARWWLEWHLRGSARGEVLGSALVRQHAASQGSAVYILPPSPSDTDGWLGEALQDA